MLKQRKLVDQLLPQLLHKCVTMLMLYNAFFSVCEVNTTMLANVLPTVEQVK